MERRNEARTEFGPWLERLAWNAAALAALAVMLLVLLASLEWLDHVTKAPVTGPLTARTSAQTTQGAVERAAERKARALPALAVGRMLDSEDCVAPPRGSG
jgi:hypothetical protein